MLSDAAVMDVSGAWMAAREVQQRFMQRWDRRHSNASTEALDLGARCRQALELGGDFYDFVPLADSRLAVAIGDASGKGLAAALMISNVQSSLRTALLLTGGGSAAIDAVNRQVHGSSLANRYATLFYGVFDLHTRMLRYVNAGHLPPMVIRCTGSIDWLESGGAPVGLFPDWIYEEGAVQLNPGDVVVACTDGITETVNPAGEEWGVNGVREAALQRCTMSAGEMVQAIFSSLDQFSQGCQTDDATVMVLRVPAHHGNPLAFSPRSNLR